MTSSNKQYQPDRKETLVGEWQVLLLTDEDGHLAVHIKHNDGSKVIAADADIGDEDEWAERFSTEFIEKEHADSLKNASNEVDDGFHLGHEFSAAMPEIKTVKGRPLADLIYSPERDASKLSDDDFIEQFDAAIKSLSDSDIEMHKACDTDAKLARLNGDKPITRKDYLQHSFSSFVTSLD